ncbi:Uncharacterised protein [Bordetella pertussis]|nr:Uncharacterised protein [Bordetella pertussis]
MRRRREGVFQVFLDGAGLGEMEAGMRQGRHPGGQGAALVGLHALLAGSQVHQADFELQLLFGQGDMGRHGVGAAKTGVDVQGQGGGQRRAPGTAGPARAAAADRYSVAQTGPSCPPAWRAGVSRR